MPAGMGMPALQNGRRDSEWWEPGPPGDGFLNRLGDEAPTRLASLQNDNNRRACLWHTRFTK